MPRRRTRLRPELPLGLAAAICCLALGPASSLSGPIRTVVQKGRTYLPVDLFLRRGDTIVLRNGDESAIHHAFIEADRFAFDAGDQEPGTEARLVLSEPGDFVLRCGIHPRMTLTVRVR